jgi:hypothetical protein
VTFRIVQAQTGKAAAMANASLKRSARLVVIRFQQRVAVGQAGAPRCCTA